MSTTFVDIIKQEVMKIVLATDGSVQSTAAVKEIAHRSFPAKTEVHVVVAYATTSLLLQMDSMGASQDFYAQADRYALEGAQATAKKAAEMLTHGNPDLIVSTLVVEGPAKNVILEEAEKIKADLIVVGSHGYGMVERFLLGSVSQSVAMHAHCSVEIVRK